MTTTVAFREQRTPPRPADPPTLRAKAPNLIHHTDVVVTTGTNTWQDGLDIVIEGTAEHVTDPAALHSLADDFHEKYSGDWDFEV